MQEQYSQIEELKVIYKEIIDGYSFIEDKNLYVKHLNDLENAELSRIRANTFKKVQQDGLPSEKERIQQLIYSEQWSDEKEDRIASCRLQIIDNEKQLHTISTNVIKEQRDLLLIPIKRIIEQLKNELQSLILEKRTLIGITAEDVSEKEAMYFFLKKSFFNDSKLLDIHFKENMDDIETDILSSYIRILETNIFKLCEENIRKISILGFFLTPFSYSKDDISKFLRKPLSELTSFQLTLFSLGCRNLNVLSEGKADPPEDIPLDEILKWFDSQYSIIIGRKAPSR